jgi:hypothetical protein
MAVVRINSFNDGSLLRRTLVHVTTMVLGSLAFVGILSFVLVTLAKGALPKRGGEEAESEPAAAAAELNNDDPTPAAPIKAAKTARPPRRKGVVTTPEASEPR